MNGTVSSNFCVKVCSFYEVSRNFAKWFRTKFREISRNCAKFRLNPFREISRNFAKFRETGKKFRLVSCFAKWGKPNFVATLTYSIYRRGLRWHKVTIWHFLQLFSIQNVKLMMFTAMCHPKAESPLPLNTTHFLMLWAKGAATFFQLICQAKFWCWFFFHSSQHSMWLTVLDDC